MRWERGEKGDGRVLDVKRRGEGLGEWGEGGGCGRTRGRGRKEGVERM